MKASLILVAFTLCSGALTAADYKSPYKVDFTFKEEELIGDLLKGPRGDWKDEASVPYRDWYDAANQKRWRYWGPAAKHFNPEPPADWPKDEKQTTPVTKGIDCSNFTAFVYNLALGIKPTGDVQDQAVLTEAPGPGTGRTTPMKRIEIPTSYENFEKTLLTGDLLFVKSNKGEVTHVVLWVGKIGHSPDGLPLVLDSTGSGAKDSNGNEIPNGVHLRPFKRGFCQSREPCAAHHSGGEICRSACVLSAARPLAIFNPAAAHRPSPSR